MSRTYEEDVLAKVPKGLLVNGAWRPSSSGRTFDVEDPSTGLSLARVADGTVTDGQAALTAASTAQPEWQRTAPRRRAEILRGAFDRLMARIEDFALLISLEMGKPLADAKSEVVYGAEFLRWFSEEAVRVSGRYSTAPEGRTRLVVTKRAVGPCLLVTPWNFPLAMATRKVGPAVAAGCTMVLKPAELTPLTAALFASVMQEAGLPPGVLNVVQTTDADRVTRPLLADERLRKVSFTGSTAVGRRILATAAQRVLRCSMELGGNAPFVVFADADLEAAVDGAMMAKMRNMGQACTAANRFLVQAPVEDEFAARLGARMRALRLGRGTEPGTTVGPMINDKGRRKIQELVDDAIANGARVLTGGAVPSGEGYFYPPTVLVDVPRGARILREEIFGPVAPIVRFHDEDEAVTLANDTEYGLAAYVYTRDWNRSVRLGERLESGMLGWNVGAISNAAAPFGGVKQSGLGREGGFEGIGEYLATQYMAIGDPYADVRGA
jgi:succinate-semialdehyde dehydrogenase/glutarate-semialdehyde dehydrogenase